MPEHVCERVAQALNDREKSVKGSRVLVLGVTYKRDVDDVRESPALDILRILESKGARVGYNDPYVPELHLDHTSLRSEELLPAVRGADVVVLATSSAAPVIEDRWVAPGTHVIGVGACRPTEREMDPELVARSYLVVDSRAAALEEAGDILLAIQEGRFGESHISAELGEIACGVKPGRADASQLTVFKSLGLAIEDVVSAGLVYRSARTSGRGMPIPL
jgi:ornithine cyclodeaminase/alanine dehydrogenase-like protein (mu-crystallin family)